MSKIGNQPVSIPEDVTVAVVDGRVIVKGPGGELSENLLTGLEVRIEDGQLLVLRKNETDRMKAFHGLLRSLIMNMVIGVTDGWSKNLEMVGTGYRAVLQGKNLSLSVGYSHPILIEAPEGIMFKVEGQNKLTVEGINRQLVGDVSAKIRAVRPPEPYKGKGIRYVGEKIRRKAGKAASSGGG
jgi:large subunit ribosomal protein L6